MPFDIICFLWTRIIYSVRGKSVYQGYKIFKQNSLQNNVTTGNIPAINEM